LLLRSQQNGSLTCRCGLVSSVIRTALPLLLVSTAVAMAPLHTAATAAPEPDHSLVVSGTGVATYPAFDPDVERYAATTTPETAGSLTITATTTDPAGRIWIDGALDPDGTATVAGLEDGDEVAVFIDDAAGRSVHAVVYLPHGFPALTTPVASSRATPGHVLITPNRFANGSDTYEAAVDARGVPVFVHANRDSASQDFKPTGFGGYTVFRDDVSGDAAGSRLVQLDEAFEPVREVRNIGLTTDAHDAILREDGSRIMAAYERDPANHDRQDAVLQEVDAAGEVVRTWNSADHFAPVDPTLTGDARDAAIAATDTMNPFVTNPTTGAETMRLDYAHINSWELVDGDQNLLLSFRHTSSVVKIAWSDAEDRTDGRDFGDVVWRLGGKFSDFDFTDDPYAGPCAQHTASQLDNGNILIFDNGSPSPTNGLFNDAAMCPDPADPAGEPVGRQFTRITEYELNERLGTARLVWEYTHPVDGGPEWFALFAGGVNRLGNGNTLISWASARKAMVTEVEAVTDEVVWQLEDDRSHGLSTPYFSYRAVKHQVADAIDPTVVLEAPADGAVLDLGSTVRVAQQCRDRGGSSLQQCTSTATSGLLDTSRSGPLTLQVVAVDGAGNRTVVTRGYTVSGPPSVPPVTPAPANPARPDAVVRAPGGSWVGDGQYDGRQRVRTTLRRASTTVRVRLQNDGGTSTDLRVRGTSGSRAVRVRYFVGAEDVTRQVRRGRLRLAEMAAGEQVVLKVKISRREAARSGDRLRIRVRANVPGRPDLDDAVQAVVRVRGGQR
jgi:hypothetical protein